MSAMGRATLLALAGGCALAMGMGIGRFAYTPVLPYMQRDLGLAISVAGYVASANFAGYLLGALMAIRVPREHRSRWFQAGLALSLASTLLMALAQAPWLLAALRLAGGAASALILIHGSAIVLDALAREGRPTLFSVLYAGVGSGIALTAVTVEVAARLQADAAAMWLALGGCAALLALPATLLRDPPADARAPGGGGAPDGGAAGASASPKAQDDERARSARRALRWLTAAYAGLGIGYVITATFIVVMVRGRPDWQRYEMLVWLVVGLAGAPSNYLWMRVAQRADAYRAMIAAYLLEAGGVLCAASAQSLALVMLGAALLGGTFMGITALGLTTARTLSAGDSGPAVARMTVAFGAGQIVGPAVGGWMAQRSGDFVAPSWLAAITLFASAAMVLLARRHARSARLA
jgi:predicted MFS family arabinose efflux permease